MRRQVRWPYQGAALWVTVALALIVGVVILVRPQAATPTYIWKVLPWGDSNTEGGTPPGGFCSINPGGYSYRGNLYKKLVADGYAIDFVGKLQLNGCTGMTEEIPDLDHGGYGAFAISDPGRDSACNDRSPRVRGCGLLENIDVMGVSEADIILLMIGFNGRGPASALEALVTATIQANPDVSLFVGGYPNTPGDYGDMQDLRDKALEMANRSATDGIYYVDFNRALPDGGDFIGDGVHHSQQGAAKIAQRFYDAIIASGVLGRPGTGNPTPTPSTTPTSQPTGNPTPTTSPTPTTVPTGLAQYDIAADGRIDINDLAILIRDYPRPGQPIITNSPADFDANGRVDVIDLSKLISNWGKSV